MLGKGANMKYILSIVIMILVTFISIFMFTINMNKDKNFKMNVKLSSIMMVVTLPIISLVGGTLFLVFKLIETILNLNIETFNVFLISMIGVFIIFLCDLMSKKIIGEIVPVIFAKKYKNENLNEEKMLEIINNSRKKFNLYTLVIMYLLSLIFYGIVMKIISVETSLIFLILISFINLISYKIFFRTSAKA